MELLKQLDLSVMVNKKKGFWEQQMNRGEFDKHVV
jgi:hypothetical protein